MNNNPTTLVQKHTQSNLLRAVSFSALKTRSPILPIRSHKQFCSKMSGASLIIGGGRQILVGVVCSNLAWIYRRNDRRAIFSAYRRGGFVTCPVATRCNEVVQGGVERAHAAHLCRENRVAVSYYQLQLPHQQNCRPSGFLPKLQAHR